MPEGFSMKELIADHLPEATKRLKPEELAKWTKIAERVKKRYPEILSLPMDRIPELFPNPPAEAVFLIESMLPTLAGYYFGTEISPELIEEFFSNEFLKEGQRIAELKEEKELSKEEIEKAKLEILRRAILALFLWLAYCLGWFDAQEVLS